jgi:hypothetical protein
MQLLYQMLLSKSGKAVTQKGTLTFEKKSISNAKVLQVYCNDFQPLLRIRFFQPISP